MNSEKSTRCRFHYLAISLCSFTLFSACRIQQSDPSAGILSNPVTEAITAPAGAHTFNVGPGKDYEEPDTVPWGSLAVGDVVNIFRRSTPYKYKIGLRGQGTANSPIVINGVTDASGNRPCFDFKDARTAVGCNSVAGSEVFTSPDSYHNEAIGGIILKRGPEDDYNSYEPRWIQIKNLELKGAANGNAFTELDGTVTPYNGAGGIHINRGEDILLENLVVHDNAFGIFTMAKNEEFFEACKRITVRSCRVWDNGVSGSYYEHNLYVQSHMPVIEGNWIGQVRAGSLGSSYKSRSSGEIFRYNYVLSSARAIDWVHSEEQSNGIAAQSEYGTDYAYGNIIVNDGSSAAGAASSPIHYGGDNLGEQRAPAAIMADPGYRKHLYFWNNTVVMRSTQAQCYKMCFFDLSLVSTTVDAWNNIFAVDSGTETQPEVSWLETAGVLRLRGANLVFGNAGKAMDYDTSARYYTLDKSGTLITGDPLLNASLIPGSGSAAIDKSTGLPAGLPADSMSTAVLAACPLNYQPVMIANGMSVRSVKGAAMDLGAMEGD